MNAPVTLHSKKFTIKVSTIGFILLIIVNLLPDEWFHIGKIYSSMTPAYIRYKWLNYSFGILELLILLYGIYLICKQRHKWIWTSVIVLFVRELFYLLFSEYSAIAEGRFEIYLCLFVGIALIEWQLQYSTDWEEAWNKFLIIMLVNVMSIYLNVVMGRSGFIGRFNAVNLDVGTTGVLAGITFTAMLFNENFKNRILWAVLAVVGLILSGSRLNLLITMAMTAISFFLNTSKRFSEQKLFRFRLSTLIVLIGLLGIAIFYGQSLLNRFEASRIVTIFNSDYLDNAISGRPASLSAGLNMLKKNPLGLSAYFINLQYHTVLEGFVTFPHFGFLVQLIMFGPLALIPLYMVIKSAVLLFKHKNWKLFIPVLYLIIYNTVGGGPIVNPKIIYIFGGIFTIGWLASRDEQGTSDRFETAKAVYEDEYEADN